MNQIIKLLQEEERSFEILVLEGLRFLHENPHLGFGDLRVFLTLEYQPFTEDGWKVVKDAIAVRYLSDVF